MSDPEPAREELEALTAWADKHGEILLDAQSMVSECVSLVWREFIRDID